MWIHYIILIVLYLYTLHTTLDHWRATVLTLSNRNDTGGKRNIICYMVGQSQNKILIEEHIQNCIQNITQIDFTNKESRRLNKAKKTDKPRSQKPKEDTERFKERSYTNSHKNTNMSHRTYYIMTRQPDVSNSSSQIKA